jgi:uncharacterized membrane protein
MVFWGVVAVAVALAVPVAFVWMLVVVIRDRGRLNRLEQRIAWYELRLGKIEAERATGAPAAVAEPSETTMWSGEEAERAAKAASLQHEAASSEQVDAAMAAAVPLDSVAPRVPDDLRPMGVEAVEAAPDDGVRGPVVLRPDRLAALAAWLTGNWTYVLAAVSLAFAGVFLVRYGIENGYLSPTTRVMAAVVLGVALIAAGERFRRKNGAAAGLVPATFSGAGFVSIFAGVVSARLMYGLIGPGTAMAGLVATALAAVVIGWFHGPFLAAIGLIGAAVAPFIVAGDGSEATWLYAYFPVIAAMGLGIDTLRRWAWVSVLALVLGYGGLFVLNSSLSETAPAVLALTAMALLAVMIPARSLWPAFPAPSVLMTMTDKTPVWPGFPVRLAGGALMASSLGLLTLWPGNVDEMILIMGAPVLFVVALAVWGGRAPGLSGLWIVPVVAFLFLLVQGADSALLFEAVSLIMNPPAEVTVERVVWPVLPPLLAVVMSVALGLRSLRVRVDRTAWTLGAVLALPLALVVMDRLWFPEVLFGPGGWAAGVMAAGALMVGFAGALARADGGDLRRASLATAMALGLIGFAMTVLLSDTALTVGIAVLVVAAAALDRRFGMVALAWFAGVGALVLGWRLASPFGVYWGYDDASLTDVVLGYGGAAAGCVAAWALLPKGGPSRLAVGMLLEAGAMVFGALLVNLVQASLMQARGMDVAVFWSLSLIAVPWMVVALVQAALVARDVPPGAGRTVLCGLAGLIAVLMLGASVGPYNPLWAGPDVAGPLLLDTLTVAYVIPALVLLAGWVRLRALAPPLRLGLLAGAAGLVALWIGLEIRRFWQGPALDVAGVTQAELYTYTIAMILLGAGLLYQAIASGSATLRRVAMGVIALTAAKVFLIDSSGLTGLVRVFSFLGLGLALSGLAWLNGWAARRQRGGAVPPV